MSPRRTAPQRKERSSVPPWLIVGGLALFVVLAGVVGADFLSKSQPSPASAITAVTERGLTANGKTLGDSNAPIAVVEFSDFQ